MTCLAMWAIVPRGSAQTPLLLGLKYSAGRPILSISGAVGTVYSLQYASDLSQPNPWVDWTLLQVQEIGDIGTDPSAPATGQRFYRAVSVPVSTQSDLVFIPPGTFTMGSPANEVERYSDEGPRVRVTLMRGFLMGKYEVTQAEYQATTGSSPSYFKGYPTHPVETVTWQDATNYCGKLTEKERQAGRLPAGYTYRLPTEAEWEYAARAGTSTRFSHGDDSGYVKLGDYAWFSANGWNVTHPVGQKLPNPWGLYDMNGNVWEWCLDWYGPYGGGSLTDPRGSASGSSRVIRGGDWSSFARACRSATRDQGFIGEFKDYGIGFRVVLAQVSRP